MCPRRRRPLKTTTGEDFSTVQTATLTPRVLIIGFSFSMAIARYDLRKNYEEAEANAIGTEYVRAGATAQPSDGKGDRAQLRKYLGFADRVLPSTRNPAESLDQSMPTPRTFQDTMWSAVQSPRSWRNRHP